MINTQFLLDESQPCQYICLGRRGGEVEEHPGGTGQGAPAAHA